MEGVHLPVSIQKPNKEQSSDTNNNRQHVGTIYFPDGTPASEVCRYVNQRQQSETGIWLLQRRVDSTVEKIEPGDIEDGEYVNVRDSRHRLQESETYVVMYFNGPKMFL